MKVKSLSHVRLFATPWTVAHQAPPSMGFSRQENWSGLPFPSPVDLPDSGIEPMSPTLQADALTSVTLALRQGPGIFVVAFALVSCPMSPWGFASLAPGRQGRHSPRTSRGLDTRSCSITVLTIIQANPNFRLT